MSKNTLPISATQMMNPFNEKEFKDQFELALTSEFLQYEAKAKELQVIASTITCNNNDELAIAKGRILDTAQWVKMLTKKHKTIKAPLLTITRILDSRKKGIEDSFDAAKTSIQTKITFYEMIEKKKEADRLNKIKEAKAIEDQKILEETNRLNRLVMNVRALLYGGMFVNKNGESIKPGCTTIEEVEKIEEILKQSLPGPATFSEKSAQAYDEMTKMITEMVVARKQSVLTTGGTVLSDTEANLISETGSIIENQGRRLTRENEKIDRDLAKTEQGFRRTIQHEIYNIDQVPREFLMVNDSAINQWKIEHREEILEGLKTGSKTQYSFIAGVKLSVTQTSIVK